MTQRVQAFKTLATIVIALVAWLAFENGARAQCRPAHGWIAGGGIGVAVPVARLDDGTAVGAGLGIYLWDGINLVWNQVVEAPSPGVSLSSAQPTPGGGFVSIGTGGTAWEWRGERWHRLGDPFVPPSSLSRLLSSRNGSIYAVVNATPSSRSVLRWTGLVWEVIGVAGGSSNAYIYDALCLPNGDLVVCGTFSRIDETPADFVASWDGAVWRDMGIGLRQQGFEFVASLAVRSNNRLIAGFGAFNYIAEYDGAAWRPLGVPTGSNFGRSLAVSRDDVVFAAADSSTGLFCLYGNSWVLVTSEVPYAGWCAFSIGDNVVAATVGSELQVLATGGFYQNCNAPVNGTGMLSYGEQPPSIVTAAGPTGSCSGAPATFEVQGVGRDPIAYQWQIEVGSNAWVSLATSPIALPCFGQASATAPTSNATAIRIVACPLVSQYRVRCVLTNACGTTASAPFSVAVQRRAGDANGDGVVNFVDLNTVLTTFGASVIAGSPGDVNGDGVVSFQDLNIVLTNFGGSC